MVGLVTPVREKVNNINPEASEPRMVCTSCQTVLPKESHFCSKCGASLLDGAAGTAGDQDRRIAAILAEANLLRMRAQWHDAESRCIDVMRVNPNDVHAHSLLGDIFRDQGRYDEASQWYQMALDLNPNSAADRGKLIHVEQNRAKDRSKPDFGPGQSVLDGALGTQRLIGLPPSTWLRALTAMSVLFLVVVSAILISLRDRTSAAKTGSLSSDSILVTRPIQGSAEGLPMPTPRTTATGSQGTNPATENGGRSNTPSSPENNETRKHDAYTDKELALQSNIARRSGLGTDTAIAAVSIDPRGQAVTILLTHLPHDTAIDRIRYEILQTALQAAKAALISEPGLQRASLNVRITNETGHIEPAFSGDTNRAALQTVLPTSTPDQVLAAFANVWWAPLLMPASIQSGSESQESGQ
jgi:hypothetical protein